MTDIANSYSTVPMEVTTAAEENRKELPAAVTATATAAHVLSQLQNLPTTTTTPSGRPVDSFCCFGPFGAFFCSQEFVACFMISALVTIIVGPFIVVDFLFYYNAIPSGLTANNAGISRPYSDRNDMNLRDMILFDALDLTITSGLVLFVTFVVMFAMKEITYNERIEILSVCFRQLDKCFFFVSMIWFIFSMLIFSKNADYCSRAFFNYFCVRLVLVGTFIINYAVLKNAPGRNNNRRSCPTHVVIAM